MRRGIFHPAFLHVMGKRIVMDFYVAKSISRVMEAFTNGKIRHVKGGLVRGLQDIMIRRYIDVSTYTRNIPTLSLPFSYLSNQEFEEAFDVSFFAPQMKVLIEPRGILKFRGVPIPDASEDVWASNCETIWNLLGRRPSISREVCSIARSIDQDTIPEDVKQIFSLGIESCLPVGIEYKENNLRETYVFILAEDKHGRDRSDLIELYLKTKIICLDEVREVFRVLVAEFGENDAKGARRTPFQFVLQLKCTPYQTDQIIYDMLIWSANNNIRVGTRTYDLWFHFNRDSIDGIVETKMSQEELEFLTEVHAIEPNSNWYKNQSSQRERISEIVKSYDRQTKPLSWHIEAQLTLREFYRHLYLCNVVTDEKAKSYRQKAAISWHRLYTYFESIIKAVLTDNLGIDKDSTPKHILNSIKNVVDATKFEKITRTDDPVRAFMGFYKYLHPDGELVTKAMDKRLHDVGPVRNSVAHEDDNPIWRRLVDIPDVGWQENFRVIADLTMKMCELISLIQDEMFAQKKPSTFS